MWWPPLHYVAKVERFMHLGGRLIREFDAFLHLLRSAAAALPAQLVVPGEDQFELNKVLAGLGGPPAAERARLFLNSPQSLAALCLYLAMGQGQCPVGVFDPVPMGRIKQLVHVVAHALVPMAAGGQPLTVDEVSDSLSDVEIRLRPVITYHADGAVAALARSGGRNVICSDPAAGPFKVAINPPESVQLDGAGPLYAVTVQAAWRETPLPFFQF